MLDDEMEEEIDDKNLLSSPKADVIPSLASNAEHRAY